MESDYRIFVYKMTTDNGGAPCVQGGLLSLAICKPMIRRKAKVGDWVIGLGGMKLGEGIIYVARVTGTAGSEYYQVREFARRPDCIYHFRDDGLARKQSAAYHKNPANLATDLGTGPEYRNARVLLSLDFRYFGKRREAVPPDLKAFADSIGRGHRVNHDPARRKALVSLIGALWQKHTGQMVIGEPHSKPDATVCCSRDEGTAECH
jgi:hypothetical protein